MIRNPRGRHGLLLFVAIGAEVWYTIMDKPIYVDQQRPGAEGDTSYAQMCDF